MVTAVESSTAAGIVGLEPRRIRQPDSEWVRTLKAIVNFVLSLFGCGPSREPQPDPSERDWMDLTDKEKELKSAQAMDRLHMGILAAHEHALGSHSRPYGTFTDFTLPSAEMQIALSEGGSEEELDARCDEITEDLRWELSIGTAAIRGAVTGRLY